MEYKRGRDENRKTLRNQRTAPARWNCGLRGRDAPLTRSIVWPSNPDPKQQHYLNLYKMGDGPLYSFFIPYHLVHFEVPNAIARVVLFRDSIAKPLGGRDRRSLPQLPKRVFQAGRILDDYGMYMTYGEAVNVDEMSAKALPAGGTCDTASSDVT